MTADEPTKILRVNLAQTFDPDSREDRAVLVLLIALECFTAVDEAFVSANWAERLGESGRKNIFFLLKAGYLAEAFRAFIFLDERDWFGQNTPVMPEKREEFNAALLTLRELSPVEPTPPVPCRCCGKVHNDSPRTERRPPAALLRLRDKGAFHWDSAAVRDAYRRLLGESAQPAVLRFVGRRIREVESPLAASVLSGIIGETEDLEADIRCVLKVSELLRLVVATSLGRYLLARGATLEAEDLPDR